MTRAEHARRSGRSSKFVTRQTRLAIYLRDGFVCCYCGKLCEGSPRHLSLDHLRPQNGGGKHHPRNLVTACIPCNSARRHCALSQFPLAVRQRIARQRRRSLTPHLAFAHDLLVDGSYVESLAIAGAIAADPARLSLTVNVYAAQAFVLPYLRRTTPQGYAKAVASFQ
jgi:hypothetical protein